MATVTEQRAMDEIYYQNIVVVREHINISGQVRVWEGADLGQALERAIIEQYTIGPSVRHTIMVDGTKGKIIVAHDGQDLVVLPNGKLLKTRAAKI